MSRAPQLLAFAAVLLCGCTQTAIEEHADPDDRLDKSRRVLGVGKYAAFDLGDHCVVYASGVDPTTSWRHDLVREQGRTGPVLTFYKEPPRGAAGAAFTPFIVAEVLLPGTRKTVIVRDANGEHELPVVPPPEVPPAEMSREHEDGG